MERRYVERRGRRTDTGEATGTWAEGAAQRVSEASLRSAGSSGTADRLGGAELLASKFENRGEVRWEQVRELRCKISAGSYHVPLEKVAARWLAATREAAQSPTAL